MGVAITARTRRMLLMAVGGLFTLLFVVMTSRRSVQSSSNILIPDSKISSKLAELNNELSVQIPGADKLKKELTGHKLGSVDAPTKNMINGNKMVKDKDGKIDESKVIEADMESSRKVPLVAGDPESKKAHDMGADKTDMKLKGGKAPAIDADAVKNKVDTPQKLTKGKKPDNTKEVKKPQKNAAMKAQEKAENEGVSVDKGSSFNPKKEFDNILSKSPVVIFSKSYCPFSKKLKTLLEKEYNITPPPVIIELDEHENGKELQEHIGKETGRFTVPNFIIDGASRGGADDILALHSNDELVDLFHSWADGAAKMKKIGSNF